MRENKWGGWNARPLHPEISKRMAAQGIETVSELALKAGINRVSLSGYLSGANVIPFPAAGKVARALHMSLERLLEVIEEILHEKAACVDISTQGNISSVENKYSIVVRLTA